MKFRKIKKIDIGSVVFKVTWDKTKGDGEFWWPDKKDVAEIIIGTKHEKTNPTLVLEIIIHELKEIIQVQQLARWNRGNGDERYVYNHAQHTDLCSRLAGLLPKFVRFEK